MISCIFYHCWIIGILSMPGLRGSFWEGRGAATGGRCQMHGTTQHAPKRDQRFLLEQPPDADPSADPPKNCQVGQVVSDLPCLIPIHSTRRAPLCRTQGTPIPGLRSRLARSGAERPGGDRQCGLRAAEPQLGPEPGQRTVQLNDSTFCYERNKKRCTCH